MSQAGSLDVDLVLADPPYQFDDWPSLLAAVRAPFVVAEAGRALDRWTGLADAGWTRDRAASATGEPGSRSSSESDR